MLERLADRVNYVFDVCIGQLWGKRQRDDLLTDSFGVSPLFRFPPKPLLVRAVVGNLPIMHSNSDIVAVKARNKLIPAHAALFLVDENCVKMQRMPCSFSGL